MESSLPNKFEMGDIGVESGCLSDLVLDGILSDELSFDAQQRVSQHVASCARCRERLDTMRRFQQTVMVPPLVRQAPTQRREGKWLRSWHGRTRTVMGARTGIVLALAASVALLVTHGRQTFPSVGVGALEGRSKGENRLDYYVKRGEQIMKGAPADVLRPGDRVEFAYRAPTAGYLAILSVDGGGSATVYYPTGRVTVPIEAGEQVLPQSTLLDEVLGEEEIFALFCSKPVQLEPIRSSLASGERSRLSVPGCQVESIRFEKRKP